MSDATETPSIADVFDEHAPTRNPLVALGTYLSGRRGVFGVAAASTILWRLANLVPPYLLGTAIDAFFTGQREQLSVAFVPTEWVPTSTSGQFQLLVALFGGLVVGQTAVNVLRHLSWRWLQQSLLHELRMDAYESVQHLDVATFESEETGDVMSVLNNDVNQLRTFLDDGAQTIIQVAGFFVALLLVMLGLHWQLTLVAVSFVPLMLLVVFGYKQLVEPRYDDRREAVGRLNTHLQTVIDGIETVKAFTNEAFERERLARESKSFWRADWRAARLSGVFFPARQLVSLGVMLGIVVVGGWWAIAGPPLWFTEPLTPGEFVTFYFFGQMFVGQSSRLGDIVDTYTDAKSSAKRVFGLLHYPTTRGPALETVQTEPTDQTANTARSQQRDTQTVGADEPQTTTGDTKELGNVAGAVSFEDVTFRYPGESEPALDDIDFEAAAGSYVGLVGPTGAGKSTVLKLLLRFYDPEAGKITVDGTDIATVPPERLREVIGYVGQESRLLDGTVRENIAYGDHDADDADIERAARRANAHQFVTELRDGYDTEIGERGVKLSGGQRQRIALARAILRDPEILLLDEATSHVDNRTELYIQEGLAELIDGRTTIAIAHRLSTIRTADRILVLDDGEIRERGTHGELLAADGLYADLWRLHTGEADELSSELSATSN